MKNSNLTKSTIFGVFWNGINQLIAQVFQFIILVILARLLEPQEFGIVGLATIYTGFVAKFSELGLSAAIVQRKDIDDAHLSTSFWASMGMGAILFILSIIASQFVADFFQEDILRPIIIVTSVGFIIGSINVVQIALLIKGLNFKKTSIIEICSMFASGIISIILAMNGYGVWSLVIGGLSGKSVSVIIIWKTSSWRPSLEFSFTHFKELFGFGWNVMGSSLFNYIGSNMDNFIVGKSLGVSALGYYSLAYNLITFPLQKVSRIITAVTFPAFSAIQDHNELLREGYLKSVRYISLVTFPMLAGMFVIAPEFVIIVYGAKWAPIILPIQILCLAGALKSVGTTVGSIFLSKGRSDIELKWNIFTAIVLPIAVIIGANYGIAGVASAITIMTVILIPIIQMIMNKLINLSMYSYSKAIYPGTIGSIFLIIAIETYQRIMMVYDLPGISILVSSIIIGIIVYLLIILIFFNSIFKEIKLLIQKLKG